MCNELTILKGRSGLYSKFLERLYSAWQNIPQNSRKEYLTHKEFRTKIPKSFQIKLQDSREILLILADLGFISIEKRGIMLNFRVIENE